VSFVEVNFYNKGMKNACMKVLSCTSLALVVAFPMMYIQLTALVSS
jgi:hypothetical protein